MFKCIHIDDTELLFDGDGFEGTLAVRRKRDDARAFAVGLRLLSTRRDIFFLTAGRMVARVKDLAAEVGQLGGFFKAMTFTRRASGQTRGRPS